MVAVVFIPAAACPATAGSLIEAASSGESEKVQVLLAKRADANAEDNNGATALI